MTDLLHPAAPRGHRDPAVVEAKRAAIDADHVRPLNDLVREINAARGEPATPWFDPGGGGVRAELLILLECPGPKASAHEHSRRGGSGFVSPDNDDTTAATIFALREEAGLDRRRTVVWNQVPWYLPSADGRRTLNPTRLEGLEGDPWLGRLLALLPALRLVLTMGTIARDGWMRHLTTSETTPLLPTLCVPHPSPRYLNTTPAAKERIRVALRRAAAELSA